VAGGVGYKGYGNKWRLGEKQHEDRKGVIWDNQRCLE
jgi:hypothetical protein